MGKPIFLTKAGFDKFLTELDYLRTYKRAEIAKRLRDSIRFDEDQVDLEFEQAKHEQGLVERRIKELELLLDRAQILRSKKSNGKVILGSTVTVQEDGRAPEE